MTIINLYQLIIDDEKCREVNLVGWGGVAWGNTYMGLTMSPKNDPDWIKDRIQSAIIHRLYSHAHVVETEAYEAEDALEAVFTITNGMQFNDFPCKLLHKAERSKSGSVGDIAIDPQCENGPRGWMCMSIGWRELEREVVEMVLCNVSTWLPDDEEPRGTTPGCEGFQGNC